VHNQSLFLAHLIRVRMPFKSSNGNRPGAGFQGFIHDPVRHIPEQPIHAAFLFARQPVSKVVFDCDSCALRIEDRGAV